jgi:DNA-binding MarR family transcriptional regulator
MTITQLNTARYHGLNMTDMQLLLLLAEHGPIDMSDLATRLGLTNSAITVVARKLVAKHLIRRIRDDLPDGDRRWVYLDLCELGRVRIHQITGHMPDFSPVPFRIDCSLTPVS